MKGIFNILKKRSELIIGVFIGLVIATTVSYGVDSIQSSSVSYTKDGNTMTVKQVIDDLIVKVNKKGSCGVFNITLRAQKMSASGSTTTTWLKGFIDETLNTMFASIDNLKEVNTDELTKLKNGNYTWSSSDTSIVTIDGINVTPKKAGNVNVIATTNGGASVTIPLVISENLYLADVASVGDYVSYDAGTWTSSANKPTNQGEFGGYTKGQNKANSVSWCYKSIYTTSLKGWRVYSIDKNTKTVTLIHAGQPECYYHAVGYANSSVTNLNNRASSQYLNSNYAQSAHMMNYNEALTITGSKSSTTNNLRTTGDWYWLATAMSTNDLWSGIYDGSIGPGYDYHTFGIRPVVVLKSKILTTGKGIDAVGQTAWTLVKP